MRRKSLEVFVWGAAVAWVVASTPLTVARAGGELMEPLAAVELYGTVCDARALRVGGETVHFVCEFDPAFEAGLIGMPRITEETVAAVTLVQRHAASGAPLERQAVQGRVSQLRLYGGTECRHSGEGEVLAAGGERLTYTCTSAGADAGTEVALVGPLRVEGDAVLADRVVLARTERGPSPLRSERFAVEALTVDVEGYLQGR
ncbi:hypothetical protein [Truepera radiovictrix]|uniref:Uncharacterized protein n=1 Tax=Truepera radiovictrix (strain DSM 17093 / CIP 108686 / LMG 22925 / RQ-24) TaxID=649638 RepID=D7CSW5_TRURR|nr:hypothetical protein [Truepera radiovictrix]ADI13732.1 hypothetical protein Trad_0596 [Truepera radiovictrix DSM 17093]WMT57703.1 hypothetical protein RCV51_01850 [Truepera radiovictrix]